jgi:hypothetical protein
MFVKAIKHVTDAIFPIFRLQQSLSGNQISASGAGFFINSKGYFVSVAHLFDDTNPQTIFQYRGRLPDRPHNPALQIVEVARDNNHDIYIGRVNIRTPNYLYFARKLPDIGKSICIGGYPLASIHLNTQGVLQGGDIRRYFQPSFVLDKFILNSGTNIVRVHDGFLIRDFGLFGMSGGPVFDINGIVFGIQGSITQPRESRSASGRSITVENALAIRSELVLSLLKQHNIAFNFLGNF